MQNRAFAPLPPKRHAHRKLGRLRAALARVRELVPLTMRGAAVSGLSALALWFYGFGALDAVWYVAGLGLLALCALSLLLVFAAALRMKIWLSRRAGEGAPIEPGRSGQGRKLGSETGRSIESGFSLPSLRFWLLIEPRIQVRAPRDVEVDERREGARLYERLRFGDHGEVRRIERTLFVRDVFGLASLGLRSAAGAEIDVLPRAGALRSLPLLRSLSGGDDVPHPLGIEQGDRLELRRYAPGDPARFIHWKVYARTQKLVVRMPERALSRAQRVAAYLVAGELDAASAATARVALEEGAFGGDFRFAADGSPAPTRDVETALVALRRSSAARAHSAEQLEFFLQELDREGPSSLVLFVPASAGPAVERVGALLRKRARAARVVIGVDGITQRERPSWFERVALAPSRSARIALARLRELIAAYRRFGCEVVVVDRESGRLLGDMHLARTAGEPRDPRARREAAA